MPTSPASLQSALALTPIEDFDVAVIATTWGGEIGYWNKEAERLYGWSAQEVLGKNIVDVTPSLSDRTQAEQIMRQLTGNEPWEGEMRVRRRSGDEFTAYVIDTPLPADEPHLCAIIGASAPADQAAKVRERNALLRAELRHHLGDRWPVAEPPLDWRGDVDPDAEAEAARGYYRCYLIDKTGVIRTVRDGLFDNDETAERFGRACVVSMPSFAGVEVWNHGRLVAKIAVRA